MRKAHALVLLALATACSSASKTPGTKDVPDAQTGDSGSTPAGSCGVGTMPSLGQKTCAPVGPSSIPQGFELATDGWGFQPVVPDAACTGSSYAVLGKTSCAPIDDCSAAFPPASADVVVSQSPATGGKKYVTTIAEALADAPSGGTIALDAGTYAAFEITQSVNVVGRCAAMVNVGDVGSASFGLDIEGGRVTLSHLTVSGFEVGIKVAGVGTSLTSTALYLSNNLGGMLVGAGAVATISQSAVEGPAPNATQTGVLGVGVFGSTTPPASKLTVDAVDIRSVANAFGAYYPGSILTVTRSVAPEERIGEMDPSTIDTWGGATVSISDSYLTARVGNLASVYRLANGVPPSYDGFPASTVIIDSSVLVQSGAESTVAELYVDDKASLTLSNSILRYQSGAALLGDDNAAVTIDHSAIVASSIFADYRIGALFVGGAQGTIQTSAVVAAQAYGLSASAPGTKLTLNDSLVTNTQFRKPGPAAPLGGAGIAVDVDGASFDATGSAFVGNQGESIGAGSQASLKMTSCIVDGTEAVPGASAQSGQGLSISWGELVLTGSLVRNSGDAALMFSDPQGGGVLSNDTIVGNALGLRTAKGMAVNSVTSAAPIAPSAGAVLLYETSLTGNTEAQGPSLALLGDAGGPPPISLDGGQ
jgi:hypothetical protein